jgi:hypothetical protein
MQLCQNQTLTSHLRTFLKPFVCIQKGYDLERKLCRFTPYFCPPLLPKNVNFFTFYPDCQTFSIPLHSSVCIGSFSEY